MKFEFKNLGPIHQGEIELADLTVLCGKNNTGKTYVTNALYSFFQNWLDLIDWSLPDSIEAEIHHKGIASIDLEKDVISNIDTKQAMKNLSENLSNFLLVLLTYLKMLNLISNLKLRKIGKNMNLALKQEVLQERYF